MLDSLPDRPLQQEEIEQLREHPKIDLAMGALDWVGGEIEGSHALVIVTTSEAYGLAFDLDAATWEQAWSSDRDEDEDPWLLYQQAQEEMGISGLFDF